MSALAIGTLNLATDNAVQAARAKLKVLAEQLGLGDILSRRIAAVISDVARRAIARQQTSVLELRIEPSEGRFRLVLHLRSESACEHLGLLEGFFEQVSAVQPGAVECAVVIPLSNERLTQEPTIQKLREQLAQRSREELMQDLEHNNRELEQHRLRLESTVESRTTALREAMHKADQANRAKSEFLSHMSHELRTPLNGVLGHSQILLRDGEVTERQRRSLAAIESSGRHLLTLINDILDLSKIEAGEFELDEAPCDLLALTLDVCNIVQLRADKKGVEVRRVLSPELPRAVRTDPTKLRQCLVNLAGNAAKFTEQGWIELRASVRQGRLIFELEDTGIGMSADELAELFQPFKQAKAGRAAGGTGLGLAISQRIIQRLGGELSVSSELGRGSVFRIELPCVPTSGPLGIADSLAPAPDATHRRLAEGQHCAVLIVDDNETNREILVSLLGPVGFETDEAEDGLVALQRMKTKKYDLVLMDLRMPRMTGEQALSEIRSDPQLAATKVIAITASIESGLMSALDALGFDAVLGKPFLLDVLLGKIEQLTRVVWTSAPRASVGATKQSSDAAADAAPLRPEQVESLLPEFRSALLVGDLQRLADQAAQLEAAEPPLPAWGRRIRSLCEDFDLQGLEQLGRQLEEVAKRGAA